MSGNNLITNLVAHAVSLKVSGRGGQAAKASATTSQFRRLACPIGDRDLLGFGEVFHGKQLPIALDDTDAHHIHVRIQNVGAVPGRFHKLGVD